MMKYSYTSSRLFEFKNESYYRSVMNTNNNKAISNFIRIVCLKKSKEELNQAEANFMRYLELVEKVAHRLADEKENSLD